MSAPSLREDPIPVIENAVVWTAAVSAIIATGATLGIVIAFVSSVIARWLGSPFDVTNLVSGLLVTATFAGMAWTTIRGEQVSVQVVTERLSSKANRVLDIIIWTLATVYLGWLMQAAFDRAAARTWPVPETVIDGVGLAPLWPWRWVFAVALIPFLLVAIVNLLRALIGRRPYDDVMEFDQTVDVSSGILEDREALQAASLAEQGHSAPEDSAPEGGERR
ncbi:TRAP transporter small permease [Microbacterium sp.]|uniref:TRAP transporter small permease n=1 Tax=Microbacterium sp. TaxID=51671 RepID=UPI003A884E38